MSKVIHNKIVRTVKNELPTDGRIFRNELITTQGKRKLKKDLSKPYLSIDIQNITLLHSLLGSNVTFPYPLKT